VKKQQLLLIGGAILLFATLLYMGSTVAPKNPVATANTKNEADNQHIEFKDLLVKAKEKISPDQSIRLNMLENSVVRGDVKDQKIHVYHQLARFWSDSAKLFEPYAWYTGEAAKLENSEKSLTFAAQLYIDNLVTEGDPAMQHWLAEQAKDLLEKALVINPNNDSSKIGLGACLHIWKYFKQSNGGYFTHQEYCSKKSKQLICSNDFGIGW